MILLQLGIKHTILALIPSPIFDLGTCCCDVRQQDTPLSQVIKVDVGGGERNLILGWGGRQQSDTHSCRTSLPCTGQRLEERIPCLNSPSVFILILYVHEDLN